MTEGWSLKRCESVLSGALLATNPIFVQVPCKLSGCDEFVICNEVSYWTWVTSLKYVSLGRNQLRIHSLTSPSRIAEVALYDPPDNFRPFRINFIDRGRQCLHRERFTRHAVNKKADAGGVFGEAGEGFGGDLAGVFAELFGEAFLPTWKVTIEPTLPKTALAVGSSS